MYRFVAQAPNEELVNELTEDIEKYSSTSFWQSLDFKDLALSLLLVLLIFIIGYIFIQVLASLISRLLKRARVSTSGIYYIDKVLKFICYFILVTIMANNLGIQTGSLIALIASLGFAIALALQGSLTDLASGIMLVVTKPIRVGDYVYLEGKEDLVQVDEIRLFNTVLKDRRNISLIVSNELIIQKPLQNLSKGDYAYTDVEVSIAYDSDLDRAKALISQALDQLEGILPDKDYLIGVNRLGESGVDLLVSAPCLDRDHAKMKLLMREAILKSLTQGGIEIPFPRMDLAILKDH
ncbi:MAG: mechanosensitive ion channel family protein [Tissierellia bacterium]|nr:mechanosensitive ion channel family protein [Tissierellia bacterium]